MDNFEEVTKVKSIITESKKVLKRLNKINDKCEMQITKIESDFYRI